MRKPIIAGNWKMHKTIAEAVTLVSDIVRGLGVARVAEVVLCPPFTALAKVREAIAGSPVGLGAQNMHWEPEGAFTGEISPFMLKELGCVYVILGHSERRLYFQELDDVVNRKTKAALGHDLHPIVCIGETLDQRESGATEDVVNRQVRGSLAGLSPLELGEVILAYEPVWAIGTGETAAPEEAQRVHAFIRSIVEDLGGKEVAEKIRVQYGGSVKPGNAAELFAKPDIDGGLIGGASLDARAFADIVHAARVA